MTRCGRCRAAERAALPVLCRGAALRFLLTRLYRLAATPPGALVTPQGPAGIPAEAALPPQASPARRLRARGMSAADAAAPSGEAGRDLDRRRLHAAIPAPAAGGRSCACDGRERELSGGEPLTTNNRMELMAAIAALEALKRPCASSCTPTASICATASPSGSTAGSASGWRTADRKPVKNVDLWQRLDAARGAPHESTGTGCAAMPATPRTSAPTRWPAPAWRRS